MTEEVKEESKQEVEETTDQSAPADETNTSDSPLSEESKTQESEENTQDDSSILEESEIDYKAELDRERALREREQSLREKAEKKIVKLKKIQKRDEDEFEEESDTSDNLVEKVAERIRQENNQEFIDEMLEEISSNVDERELIHFIYDNKIVKSGFTRKAIIEDLTTAKLLANRKKIERENKELSHALKIKSSLNTNPQFSGKKIMQSEAQPKMTAQEKKLLQWAQKFKKSN